MANMLIIGTNAANTYKTALDVTSHNVANVGTEGYSRQRAEIGNNTPASVGGVFLGGGSRVDSVLRIQADYIQSQLNNSNASVERYDQQLQLSKQLEGIVASNDEGIQQFMQRFFDSLQNLADNPTSSTNRQMVLDEAGNLESHISNLSTVLDETQTQVNTQIKGLVTEINDRLSIVQRLNQEVERAMSVGTQPPNDLLDQRNQAVLELSGYIDIKTFEQPDGRLDIFTSGGNMPLLADNYKANLTAELGPYKDENRIEVYMTTGGSKRIVSEEISGGQLGGVLDFRQNMLDQAQNDLGVTLNSLVASMNWQHYQGYDLNGEPGGDLFAPLNMTASHSVKNSGTEDGSNILVSFNPNAGVSEPPYAPTGTQAQPALYSDKESYLQEAFKQIGLMQPREYEIRYNASADAFDFYDYSTGQRLSDAGGTPISVARGASAQVEGLNFDFSNVTTVPGDRDAFLVKPHQEILKQFSAELSDTDKIAARGQSPDPSVTAPAAAAYGDNVNMANMASLQSRNLMYADGTGSGTETLLGGYSKMATNVGMYVRGTEIQLTAQQNVHNQIMTQRESLSGVSLDEEAANLMKFQQAYEAAAQIIATSQSIFQTLIGVIRG
ncbi:flagellar hook-associated protein FlgK [Thiomicrorhabdus cannonii]|uniref:flagellar hook-associated protein FlgK n=1 Tax=Thiomicrorhabdus cannonii TaxID=2748011 RepID=UPI0015BCEFAD|nr:flagellar hook-associated protein FlgK [Thiomicrorhabdus cannonii]